jgi:TRAP-type mannitol/chloroaromatic compound transport system substrate-binding protein
MNRRALLGAAATAAPAALTIAAPALAQPAVTSSTPDVRWRLTSSFPRNLDILWGAPEGIARRVAQLTDNKFQIRCFPAGEIVGAAQALDAVQAARSRWATPLLLLYVGKDPTFAFGTALPFGLNTRQQNAWFYHGGGKELLNEFYASTTSTRCPAGNTGAQMGGWFRKEIKTVQPTCRA